MNRIQLEMQGRRLQLETAACYAFGTKWRLVGDTRDAPPL